MAITQSGQRPPIARKYIVILIVLITAVTMRGLYLWGMAENNPLFEKPIMDSYFHHLWATQIANGEGLGEKPYFRAPLYYLGLGAVYSVTGPNVVLARLLNSLLGVLNCLLLALLGFRLGNERVALLAGLIAALYWPFIYFDGEILTVVLEITLDLTLLLLLTLMKDSESAWLPFTAGIAWGLSAITRPNILAFAPAILIWLWMVGKPRNNLRLCTRNLLLVGAGLCLAVAPVSIRNLLVGDEAVLIATNGGVNFFIGNNPQSDGITAVVPGTSKGWVGGYEDTHHIAEQDRGRSLSEKEVSDYWFVRSLRWITSEPGAWLRHMVYKTRLFWSPIEIGNNQAVAPFARLSPIVSWLSWLSFPGIVILATLGLVVMPRRATWFVPLSFALIYASTVILFFVNSRYRLPVVPVLILLAATGLAHLPKLFRPFQARVWAAALIAIGFVSILMASAPPPRDQAKRNDQTQFHLALAIFFETAAPRGGDDLNAAIQHYQSALQIIPAHFEARMGLARALIQNAQFEKATEQLQRCLEYHPGKTDVLLLLGWSQARTGLLPEALQTYRRILEIAPDSQPALQGLGCLLGQLARYEEAIPILERAVAADPQALQARQCLQRARNLQQKRHTPRG